MFSARWNPSDRREEKTTRTLAAGWLIDGSGRPALSNAVIEIAGADILRVHSDCGPEEVESADIDLSSCTLVPGLCDVHVHLSLSGTEDGSVRKRQLSALFQEAEQTIESHLKDHLAHGIMAIRDGGDRQGHVLRYKRAAPLQDFPVQVFASGRAWHAPGRYGAMIGRSPQPEKGLTGSIQDLEKGDLIKVIHSGPNSLKEFGKETSPQFTPEDLRGAAEYGHSTGLKLMVHANGELPVRQALEAGCDSIEHGYFMGRENLDLMAKTRIPWVPTVFAMESLCVLLKGTPEEEIAARNVEHQLGQIVYARKCGVVVTLGTDSGSLGVHHGRGVVEEMRLFLSAGMSVEEAVQCATSRAAELLGLHKLGSLKPGYRALFIAAKGGPDRLPDSLKNPEAVFVDGRRVI
ncbi:MAG: hypothetical protein C4576_08590 [Desulfobacteraceae bacterium]|nr:MAG: hypothetical protein C4576_08590 [Desulfobacteraceae bacterium]